MVIDGVDRYRVMEPMFECARVVMDYHGDRHPPAYVQGIAGTAFTIGGICPCAPTCVDVPLSTAGLLERFGFEVTPVQWHSQGPDADAQYAVFLTRLRDEISAGRPVLVWHAFTSYEWDVVCGLDETSGELLGFGSYAGGNAYARSAPDRPKAGMDVTDTIALLVRPKVRQFDARSAEVAALRFAVGHAHSQKSADRYEAQEWAFFQGRLCYRRWARDFVEPTRPRGTGDSYCLGVLRSTRRCAAAFAQQMAEQYHAAAAELCAAAAAFAREAEALDALWPHLGWDAPAGPDAARNARAAELIARAGEQYRQAIEAIEAAIPRLA